MRRALAAWICLLFAFQNFARAYAATATDGNEADRIENLTVDVLSKQVDLERFYTRYRESATKEPKLRHLRYFVLQQAAASLFLESNIALLSETGKHLRNPAAVSPGVIKGTYTTGLVGAVCEGGSSGIELCSNELIALKNRLNGNDPESARRTFVKRLQEIDSLSAERNEIVERNKSSPAYSLYKTEGEVLKYFRDWSMFEFADIYSDIKSNQTSNSIYYVFDVIFSSLFLASYIVSYRSLKDPSLTGPASIVGITGDSFGVASAPAYVGAYYRMYKFWFRRLSHQLKEKLYDAEPQVKERTNALEAAIKGDDSGAAQHMADRVPMYHLWAKRYDEYIDKYQIDLRRLTKVSRQGVASGPLISGAFLAQDIMSTNAAYRLKHNSVANNVNAFAGAIAPTVSSGASLALTTYWYVGDILHTRNLERKTATPKQLIDDRLKTLDELEKVLKK